MDILAKKKGFGCQRSLTINRFKGFHLILKLKVDIEDRHIIYLPLFLSFQLQKKLQQLKTVTHSLNALFTTCIMLGEDAGNNGDVFDLVKSQFHHVSLSGQNLFVLRLYFHLVADLVIFSLCQLNYLRIRGSYKKQCCFFPLNNQIHESSCHGKGHKKMQICQWIFYFASIKLLHLPILRPSKIKDSFMILSKF